MAELLKMQRDSIPQQQVLSMGGGENFGLVQNLQLQALQTNGIDTEQARLSYAQMLLQAVRASGGEHLKLAQEMGINIFIIKNSLILFFNLFY